MKVGFAGLGRMGVPMARNLARAGFDLSLWNRSQDKASSLAQDLGARAAKTPRALADMSDVVVTMLSDDVASDQVHFGPDGVFAAAHLTHVIEMGTMSPDHIRALVRAAPQGCQVVDAPVSGATQAAADAQLLIMAGCTLDECAPLAPIFDALGRRTICLGAPPQGAVMKLAVNGLIHGLNQTLAEVMVLAERAGIAAPTAYDVIESSAAAAPMLTYRRPLYLDEASHDVTFTVALARKDMAELVRLAETLEVPMPQGNETLRLLQAAERDGNALRDMASMLDYMRKEQS